LDARLHPRLARHKSYFEKHVAELKASTHRAIMKHRKAIIDRQLVLERLANMAIELVTTACVMSRTQRLIDEKGIDECAREIELCDLFCVEAGRRFRANRDALEGRADEIDATRHSVAETMRAEQKYFVRDAILDL
jgi:acyl-CoA dehydrogenase family protein 9